MRKIVATTLVSRISFLNPAISRDGDWSGTLRTGLVHRLVQGECKGHLTLIKVDKDSDEVMLSCENCPDFIKLSLQEIKSAPG